MGKGRAAFLGEMGDGKGGVAGGGNDTGGGKETGGGCGGTITAGVGGEVDGGTAVG